MTKPTLAKVLAYDCALEAMLKAVSGANWTPPMAAFHAARVAAADAVRLAVARGGRPWHDGLEAATEALMDAYDKAMHNAATEALMDSYDKAMRNE